MKRSFYRNLVIIIGIIAAIVFIIQFGIAKAVIPLGLDAVVVAILAILTGRLNNPRSNQRRPSPRKIIKDDSQQSNLSQWQKQHDEWWKRYKQRVQQNPQTYIPTRQEIKKQINQLRRQLILAQNQKSRLAIRGADPIYLQTLKSKVERIKKQIQQLSIQMRE